MCCRLDAVDVQVRVLREAGWVGNGERAVLVREISEWMSEEERRANDGFEASHCGW